MLGNLDEHNAFLGFVAEISLWGHEVRPSACADPESFARGGPTLNFFFKLMGGERIQIPQYTGQHRPPAKRRLNGVSLACRE